MIIKLPEAPTDYLDLRRVKSSIYEGIQREVRRDSSITLGEAVGNLWADLDCSLAGMGEEHQTSRVLMFRRALDGLGIDETNKTLALTYLLNRGRLKEK